MLDVFIVFDVVQYILSVKVIMVIVFVVVCVIVAAMKPLDGPVATLPSSDGTIS